MINASHPMRGFALLPVSLLATQVHGHGYLDLNFLIPELVETTRYGKGPYDPAAGDFSSAGHAAFSLHERLPDNLLQATLGDYGYRRGLAAGSVPAGSGTLTAALDATAYEGPWELEEDLRQTRAHLSYAADALGGRLRATLQAYDSEWQATDQIPRRAVDSGAIDRLGFIDPDLGGKTRRNALQAQVDYGDWQLGGYVVDYDFTLFSNFTYALERPADGDEFEQRDKRRVSGLWARGEIPWAVAGRGVTLRWGSGLRHDDIDEVGLYATRARQRLDTVRRDRVRETSINAHLEALVEVTEDLRAGVGLRADVYDWQVNALRPDNSGSGDDALVTPTLNLAYTMGDRSELYASWGQGFHSNDVRGATISVDPVSGDAVDRVETLVGTEGAELGLRHERGSHFNVTLAAFWLQVDSELVYVGDAGGTEPNDGSERRGIEAAAFWQPLDWLALNAAWTRTHARFRSDQGGGRRIPRGCGRDIHLRRQCPVAERPERQREAALPGGSPTCGGQQRPLRHKLAPQRRYRIPHQRPPPAPGRVQCPGFR